jgi:LuxR family transcriptional regulator, maltose regulon positive regulatory protein
MEKSDPFIFSPPNPLEGLLPRLADEMTLAMPHRVTVIKAAAGYGKSALLSSWAASQNHAVAWVGPTRPMSVAAVPRHVIHSIAEAVGAEGIDIPHASDGSVVDPASIVIDMVKEYGKPVTLVMDSSHLIDGDRRDVYKHFAELIIRQPENLAIMGASRNRDVPGVPIADVVGRLDLVDERHLQIPSLEVIRALVDEGLSRNRAVQWAEVLQGWPAAVALALTAARFGEDLLDRSSEFSTAQLASNLARALLKSLPRDLRTALVQTSYLREVSQSTATALGVSGADALSLKNIRNKGVPTTQWDDAGTFTVHSLLRRELLEEFRSQGADNERQMRLAAAELLLDMGDVLGGVEQLIEAGDKDWARNEIKRHYFDLASKGYGPRLSRALELLAEDDLTQVDRLIQRLYHSASSGQVAEAESLAHSLEAELPSATVNKSARAYLYLSRAWISFARGDLEAAANAARSVLDMDSIFDDPMRTLEYQDLARLHLLRTKILTEPVHAQDELFLAVLRSTNRSWGDWTEVGVPALMAWRSARLGEWNTALLHGERALAATSSHLLGSVYFPYDALTAVAGALREMGRPQEAIDLMEPHLHSLLSRAGLPWSLNLLSIRAFAFADLGRFQSAAGMYLEMREMVDHMGRGWWPGNRLDLSEVRYLLRREDLSRADQVLSRMRPSPDTTALAVRMDLERAPRRAQRALPLLPRGSAADELRYRIAAAVSTAGDPVASGEHLDLLLGIAQEHGFLTSIIDHGPVIIEKISAHVALHPSRFGESFLIRVRDAQARASSSAEGLDSPLSPREQQILNLLATGLSLAQIASALFVSPNTLKTHLRNLYRKMKVNGRKEAVDVGQRLLLVN